MPRNDSTPEDVARWMLTEMQKKGDLYQADAADGIAKRFGEEFAHENDQGYTVINERVLKAFRQMTGDSVVWPRSDKYWSFREETDEQGRMQS